MGTGLGRLVTLVRRGVRPACVLLPGAGGGLSPYLRLATAVGHTHNVYGVRASGLLPGEEPEHTVEEMAVATLAVLDDGAVRPDLVVGWSLGGVVGWEVCVRLAERGVSPDLVLVDSFPMSRRATDAEDDEVLATILGMLGPRPDPRTVDRVGRVFRAQAAALATYRTTRPYRGPVLMLMCSGDGLRHRAESAARWRELAPDLRSGLLKAGHFAVFDGDQLGQLVAHIATFIEDRRGAVPC